MTMKDGFKFGVGFILAYDLYKTISYVIACGRKSIKNIRKKTSPIIEKPTSQDTFPPCKNKIGFAIE